jgi:5-methylcytosine-specific restriction protein A
MSAYTWEAVPWNERLKIRNKLARRDGYKCRKCGLAKYLTIDHILSIHFGGPVMDLSNMQLLCVKCHAAKTAREQKG